MHCNLFLLFSIMNFNIENLKSQLRKGLLEYCVILLLSKKDAYASELIAELKVAKLIVVEGTIYPLLTRLKKDGILTYRWEESTSGPPRKYYMITDEGREVLKILDAEWNAIANTVKHLSSDNNLILPTLPD